MTKDADTNYLENQPLSRPKLFSNLSSVVVVFFGLIAILGWIFDITPFFSIFPGLWTMNPMTAVVFIFCGLSLYLARIESPISIAYHLSWALAFVIIILGLLKLGDYANLVSFHIDQIFFHEELKGSRMAPMTALNFVIAGAALLCVNIRKPSLYSMAQYLSCFVGGTAFLMLLGYAYQSFSLSKDTFYHSMSLNTAVAFTILALGILFIKPDQGIIRVIINKVLKNSAEIKLRNWFLLAVTILFIAVVTFYMNTNRLREASEWGVHTHKTLEAIQSTLVDTIDAETGERGYIIMDDPSYLEAYERGRQKINGDIKNISQLTLDNPSQQQRLSAVIPLINERFEDLANIIEVRKEQGIEAAAELVKKDVQRGLAASIRQALTEMDAEERRLLEIRERRIAVYTQQLLVGLFIGNFLCFLVLFFVFSGFRKEINKNRKATKDLQESQKQFERLFEFSPDAIIVINKKSIIQINRQVEKIFGYTRDELIGKPVEILIPERFSKQHVSYRTRFMDTPEIRPMGAGLELSGRRHDGSEFPVDIMLSPFETAQGKQVIGIVRDITERKRAEQALLESERRYRSLFNSINEGFCVIEVIFDENENPIDYRFLQINPSFEKQTGLKDAQGKRILELAPQHESHWFEIYGKIALTGEPAHFESRAEQLHRWYEVDAFRFGEPENRQVAIVFNNITERKQAEEEIRSARVAAENASRAKSEFLATMSHELRTPLNAIIGFSEVLKAQSFGTLNEKQKDYVFDVWESGRYLLSLINDILDLSKVEAGKMGLELGEFNLKSVLHNCLVMVKERALNREIRISMDIDESINSIVADERKIKQIVYNLLSNAIKFTPENGHIGLEVKKLDDDKEILFSIWDTGIGIEEKDKEKIFQEFIRIDSSLSRQNPGTGLGLILTKKFVELHGGKIWFESQGKNQGSRFSFTLPVASRSSVQNELSITTIADKDEIVNANQDKPFVLLIEDDPKSAKLIAEYLKDFECVLEVVSSGEEGLKKARSLLPSFIMLDIVLPNKDGWDVLIELKMDPLTKDIPVLITTVLQAQGKGLTLGALDYLIKPISKDALEKALGKVSFAQKDKSKPIKILAIDDEETSLRIIEAILIPKGFEVLKVQDSCQALALIFQEKPDLVILDLIMPGMTGFDILNHLRNNSSTKDMPVIVVTAKSLTYEEKKILQSQTKIIIEKTNFDKDALLREINLILGRIKPV